jgi:hypothetical protein
MLRKLSVVAVFCAMSVAIISAPAHTGSGESTLVTVEAKTAPNTLAPSSEDNPAPRLPGPLVAQRLTNRLAEKQQQEAAQAEQARLEAERIAQENIRIEQEQAAERAARAARLAAERAAAPAPTVVSGDSVDWMREAGIAESDFEYVNYIIGHESGWGYTKWNYGGSGAYGLGQALPASKMARFGDDYMTNPVTQLRWATAYAEGRYGSWESAYHFWVTRHVW